MRTKPSITLTAYATVAGRLATAWPVKLLPALLVLTFPALVQAQFNFTTNTGTMTIAAYTGPGGSVTIPDTTNGLPVTSIGDLAFSSTSVTSVTIPDSVISIGNSAFEFCPNLTNVTIGNGVTHIGDFAFDNSSLSSVTIPSSVTSIGEGAFSACNRLRTIAVDPLNSAYASVGGVFFNKSQTALIRYPSDLAGDYTIPDSVTNIGDYAFLHCTSLTSITIPNSVTAIGDDAFFFCKGLSSVTIPDSVTSIGIYAFWWCTGLTNLTLGNNVTNIGAEAFINCGGLTRVTIPNSVTSVGDSAFAACPGLTNVIMGNGVTDIGNQAFYFCERLARVTIPESVTHIGDSAFSDTALTSVKIPKSVINIGIEAFASCRALAGVFFEGNAPDNLYSNVFSGDYAATAYYLPGTTGWATTFAGLPTVLWNPLIDPRVAGFGLRTNPFGFTITGTANIPVVVEATTNLASPVWSSLLTINLTNGLIHFSDPEWTNFAVRFYRLRSP